MQHDAARLEKRREIRALAQLRDCHRHGADAGVPLARAIAIALVGSLRRPLAVSRARQAFDLHVHHARGDEGQHLPEEILIGALLKQLLHCHSVDGHGIRFLSVRVWEPEPTASRPMTSTFPAPLWTTWGKGTTRRCSPVALRAPSAQRRRPASYTTSRDALVRCQPGGDRPGARCFAPAGGARPDASRQTEAPQIAMRMPAKSFAVAGFLARSTRVPGSAIWDWIMGTSCRRTGSHSSSSSTSTGAASSRARDCR